MGKNTTRDYIVDVIILLLFIISVFSGVGLMRPKEERMVVSVMDEQRAIISGAHILSSFLMVVGVMLHLALHWRWMNVMTQKVMENGGTKTDVVTPVSIST